MFTWNPSPGSVIKDLTRVFTTTKIWTSGVSRLAHAGSFNTNCHDPPIFRGFDTQQGLAAATRRSNIGRMLDHHSSSGLVTSTGGSEFHCHHPAINSYRHLSWYISDDGPFTPLNLMFGSSYNTSSVYQKWSTRYTDSNAEAFNLRKPTSHPFKVWK